jgi:serine palmitoyltransferase
MQQSMQLVHMDSRHAALDTNLVNVVTFSQSNLCCIIGYTRLQRDLEDRVADYLGVESAICFPMGFGTNSMNIPSFVGKVTRSEYYCI